MHVALLRGINVGGGRKVPMAELRNVAEALGFTRVRTLIASGNLLFEADAPATELETLLEAAVEKHFGFPVDIMVRTGAQWQATIAANPFPAEAEAAPKFLVLYAGKEANAEAAVVYLSARAAPEEKVAGHSDSLWIYFANGGGRSKLSGGPKPGLWTGRNWRTVLAIGEMLCSPCP
ncbi:MAG TPA: DUF1697 domain-containing protein [Allosphingosinicella sp.]